MATVTFSNTFDFDNPSYYYHYTSGTGTYLIPFYIVSTEKIPDAWENMEEKVSVSASQITQ